MARIRIPALVALGAALLCLLAGWLVGPWTIERALTRAFASHGTARFRAERIRFNPLTLTATLDGIHLQRPTGERLVSVRRVSAGLHPASITRRRWVLRELVAREPVFNLLWQTEHSGSLPEAATNGVTAVAAFADEARVEVGRLRILDGRLQVALQDGEDLIVTRLDADIGATVAPNTARPFRIHARLEPAILLRSEGSIRGSPLALDAAVSLSAGGIAALLDRLRLPRSDGLRSGPFAGEFDLQRRTDGWQVSGDWELGFLAVDAAGGDIRVDEIRGSLRRMASNTNSEFAAQGTLGTGGVELTANWAAGNRAPDRIDFRLQGVAMSALTPIPERILGVDEVGGRLTLEATGRRAGETIAFDNRVQVQGLTFAAASGGDDDLRLAAALAEDADGRIAVALPLAPLPLDGDIALSATLANAVGELVDTFTSAPFEVLGRIGEAEPGDLGRLEFEPGTAEPSSAAVGKLAALGDALRRRPKLGLGVTPAYAPDADRRALAHNAVRLHLALATSAGPTADAGPSPDVDDPRVRDVLDEFAGLRLAAERLAELAERYPDDESARYRAVFNALVDNESISETALVRLARFRARSILDRLEAGGIASARIALAEPVRTAALPGGAVPIDLDLRVSESAGTSAVKNGNSPGEERPRR